MSLEIACFVLTAGFAFGLPQFLVIAYLLLLNPRSTSICEKRMIVLSFFFY